jgi:Carboxypeptidase regulatory-like domain
MKSDRLLRFTAVLVAALASTLLMCVSVTLKAVPDNPVGVVMGKVSGPGNVPVPGARVALFNPRTRARRETWSDEAGNYIFRDVPPGEYRVIVMIIGFSPSLLGPVDVTVGKSSALNATLALARPGGPTRFGTLARPGMGQAGPNGRAGRGRQVSQNAQQGGGNVGEQFNLQGGMEQEGAADLNSILAESGETDETGGLRFSGEAGGAGQAGPAGSGAEGDLSGAAGASNSFLLAGNVVDATAPAMQGGRRGRFSRFGGGPGGPGGPAGAPFGGGGDSVLFFGGFRRAGANRLRGNIVDSYTNSAFDARPYPLNTPSQPQAPFYREMVGFSLGGPLNIPKIYNGGSKTSFFVHLDINRGTSPQNILASLPTAAERQGDFSGTTIVSGQGAGTMPVIYQPSTTLGPRTPFTGNIIPSSMLNSAALGLLNYIPPPNLPGEVQNYHVQLSLPTASQMLMGRVGHQISSKDNLAVMYFYNSAHTDGVTGFPNITSTTTTRMQNVSLTETHNFGPGTVNNFAVNFNRARTDVINPFSFNQNITGELGILGVSQDPMDWGLPSISFTNFGGLGDATPSLTRNQTLRFSDSILHTVGKHNFEFGGDISKIQLNSLTNPDAEGTFSFTGYNTRNSDRRYRL